MTKQIEIAGRDKLPEDDVPEIRLSKFEFEFVEHTTEDDPDDDSIDKANLDSTSVAKDGHEDGDDDDAMKKKKGIIKAVLTSFEDEDKMGDVIKAGACDDWMKKTKQIPMLWGHDRKEVIGKWTDFSISDNKLWAVGTLYKDIKRAEESITLIALDAVKGVSIGFDAEPGEYVIVPPNRDKGKKYWSYEFRKINIREASLVLDAANAKAKVTQLKNEDGSLNLRSVERLLIASGLTRSEASEFMKPHLQDVNKGSMSDSAVEQESDMSDSVSQTSKAEVNNLIKFLEETKNGRGNQTADRTGSGCR